MDNVLFILATNVSWLLSLLRTLLERISSSFYRFFFRFYQCFNTIKMSDALLFKVSYIRIPYQKKSVNFLYELIKFRSSFNDQIQYNSEKYICRHVVIKIKNVFKISFTFRTQIIVPHGFRLFNICGIQCILRKECEVVSSCLLPRILNSDLSFLWTECHQRQENPRYDFFF